MTSAEDGGQGPTPAASPDLQATARKLTATAEKRSPLFFGVIAICFFLPFISFACGGNRFATMSGIDLVRGAKINVDEKVFEDAFGDLTEGLGGTNTTSPTPSQSEDTDPELWAIIALAAAVLGIAVGFTRGRFRTIGSLVAAGAGFVALVALRLKLSGDVPKEAKGVIEFQYRFGYWIVIILFGFLTLAHAMSLRSQRKSLYPPAAPAP